MSERDPNEPVRTSVNDVEFGPADGQRHSAISTLRVVTADDFAGQTERFRRELVAYCYRMLGSVDESEDVVQEIYLRAWRYYDQFEGRSSVRVWLYKIATTTCLNAIQARKRRALPSGLSAPSPDGGAALAVRPDITWLQPAADGLLFASTDDPALVVSSRSTVRLAFIAALQHLSARQRAVLVLRDVIGWKAREVAELMDMSTVAVNSALQRARAQLTQVGPVQDEVVEPSEAAQRQTLDRFMAAFERADVAALADLLRIDVEMEMPPFATWFIGRDAVCGFLAIEALQVPDQWRMVRTRANGSPALAVYRREPDGDFHAFGVDVLSFLGGRIARINAFVDPHFVTAFGFPEIFGSLPGR